MGGHRRKRNCSCRRNATEQTQKRFRHQSVDGGTGVDLRRIHGFSADSSGPRARIRAVGEASALPLRRTLRSAPDEFAGDVPIWIARPRDHFRRLPSLTSSTNVCGSNSRASRPGRSGEREDASQQGLHPNSFITFHREPPHPGHVAWFTLTDAQIRPPGSFGFATGTLMPQYGGGRADSQGGLQSFRS